MDFAVFSALAAFAAIACFTPGPNNLMLLSSGALFGWRRTVPFIAGIQSAVFVINIASVYGIGAVIEAWPRLLDFVKAAGGLWLCWLGWTFIRAGIARAGVSKTAAPTPRPFRFYQGALLQLVNPKFIVMTISSASLYVGLISHTGARALITALVFLFFGLGAAFSWAVAGHTLNRLMSEGRSAIWLNFIMGGLLIATALFIITAPPLA